MLCETHHQVWDAAYSYMSTNQFASNYNGGATKEVFQRNVDNTTQAFVKDQPAPTVVGTVDDVSMQWHECKRTFGAWTRADLAPFRPTIG